MTVFVSYTRADENLVRALRQDLDRMGHQVWLDHEIHGGELWWREIIRTIQAARVFVFALSEASWRSVPCHAEFDYAQQLGVPVLPVQVGPLDNLRIPIMERQLVDYRERSADAIVSLAGALTELTARPRVLPNPMPTPPKVPFEYLYRIAELLGPQPISPERQEIIIGQLRRHLRTERDEVARADIIKLLREFRERGEITNLNTREIDEILANVEPGEGEELPEGVTWLSGADYWQQHPVVIGPPPAAEQAPVEPPKAPPPEEPGTTGPATTPTWLRDVMAAEPQTAAEEPKPTGPPPTQPWWQGTTARPRTPTSPAAQPSTTPPSTAQPSTAEQQPPPQWSVAQPSAAQPSTAPQPAPEPPGPQPPASRWNARRSGRLGMVFGLLGIVVLLLATNVPALASLTALGVTAMMAGVVLGVMALHRRES
ncbi:TIR domain-containing protein [Saccharothrix sp. S26]|uniref:toll/interleukin-1 receptor domain-containing protein n=1 Tax=Saccharothrix sp. S26 TaxID=2907215 RepID=UPI001F1E2AEC|nr:toll/interleukin-1 receptor domain-containing protein [Saccharothrix sp. S26]MCE6997169.1 TIR domain-containing protein [Saccharothrix sp. S26]